MKKLHKYTNRFRILKGGKISLVVSSLLATTSISFAAPSGGVVTSGNASISQNGTITNINQSTNKASINWNKFNISKNETVNFNQPNSSSITLNRVVGNETSVINGALNANGQVWILNSNGVLFGKNASINTSGLLATTKNLSDENFQSGNYTFTGDSSASVINQGTINIKNNGSVIFASNEVKNSGTIKAIAGSVHLVGASEYSINLNGNSLVNLKVKKGVLDALVENSGTIIADGGEIYLTTNAVDELLKGVVNNTGVVEAKSFNDVKGKVELFAHGGEVQVGGTISAKDGFVETSGKDFTILDDAKITAGEWLIDPVDITIDDTLASTIETALGTGDVTIETETSSSSVNTLSNETSSDGDTTDGDIYVNSAITWSSENTLTLNADDEIYVNADIDVTGAGTLALYYGQASSDGGNSDYHINAPVNLSSSSKFITQKGSDIGNLIDWTIITELGSAGSAGDGTLQGMQGDLTGNYVLGSDIDASDTKNWNDEAGFYPIGDGFTTFTGNFDGLGHTIDSLTINRASEDYVGLFGYTQNSTFRNIGLTDIEITGEHSVGGLVASISGTSSISNSYATGSVSGNIYVGGLVAYIGGTSFISNSYTSGSVSGDRYVGGLVGRSRASNGGDTSISNSYATGSVSGNSYVGGLVGFNISMDDGTSSTISNSYATGSVSGNSYVGGLVGQNDSSNNGDSTISNSYATGSVSGTSFVGGLVGLNDDSTISNSYATGSVSGISYVGGLTGSASGDISNSYATGSVSGNSYVGGLVGLNDYGNLSIINSYWDTETNNGIMNDSSLGRTKVQISKLITGNEWSTAGAGGSSIEGYELYLPYLVGITKDEDKNKFTLFNSGYGTNSDPYMITNWTQLQNINFNTTTLSTDYNLLNDLTKSMDDYTNIASQTANEGKGFSPIGNSPSNAFTGTFDGLGHTINKLFINRANQNYVGLFGFIKNSTIKNIGLIGIEITGGYGVGGLVGYNSSNNGTSTISNSYASGSVSGTNGVGGLVGFDYGSVISNSYAKVGVVGSSLLGGLVGQNYSTNISNSYATGNVSGDTNVGGLVGLNDNNGDISNSYATGSVSGDTNVGGLVGLNDNNGDISNSYATGSVSGTLYVGGLVGLGSSNITNSFWNTDTTGQTTSVGGTGVTTAQLQDILVNNSLNWDMEYFSGTDNPTLAWQHPNSATTTTWVIGTPPAIVTPTPNTPNTPTQSNQERVDRVITPIQNQTAVIKQTVVNNVIKPQTPKAQLEITQSNGSNVTAVRTNKNTKLITLNELKEANNGDSVRVPLNNNSSIVLVDSGINLPTGIDQEFYIENDNK